MQLVDTHTHMYSQRFESDRDAAMQRAIEAGIVRFYLPAIDRLETPALLELEAAYPDHCRAMMGLHPCSVKEDVEEELAWVADWLSRRRFAAVGEIGLDYYWDTSFKAQQLEAFSRQIDWALDYDLPIVIHSRESMDDSIEMVRQKQDGRLRGIFHCFTGTVEQARAIMDLGFYLGIGGVLTYKNSGLAAVVRETGPDRLVLETDAPYLAPVPYRGKRNESAYLLSIAQFLADTLEISLEELADITTANAEKVFGSW